ncbi:electron transporter RnfG [Halomonas sp. 141]|uniref:RnfABCDGE type electron transport complex subunit G n=1 Tax=unclassified Halomonas TaxID=2609666 RepID=UPI0009C19AF0|nr:MULTISPECIES: RnfABCDGE type electron transport complex subunit G [unclassified Halomonas]PJX15594.1 electron transporter RnfG [Halomonas sp. 141]
MTLYQAMWRGALALGTFALVTAGSVALTRTLTAERIEQHQLAYQYRQLQAVLPASLVTDSQASLLEDTFELPEPERLGHRTPTHGWYVHHADEAAVVLPVITHQGYSGAIHLLVGIDHEGRISGVRVTRHQETPGLGDAIERQRSDWITRFDGLARHSLPPESWAVRQQGGAFDGFTGATITPSAVIDAVHDALRYAHEARLPITIEEPET